MNSKNKMPLIDLHLHLDGSLSFASARKLAAMQGLAELPEEELRKLMQVPEGCTDLNEYLTKFGYAGSLLQTAEALTASVRTLRRELAEAGVIYAEIRFAPQKHCTGGLTQRAVVEAAAAGLEGEGSPAQLILCCMRGADNEPENLETIRLAKEFLGRGVCAADLAGAEGLFPTENFRSLFDLSRELEVPCTIHAGEAAGADSVSCALDFGARRIGHGVRALEDPAAVERLSREKIPLELCPTSNLNTQLTLRGTALTALKQYPIRELLAAGVRATVNTDNLTVSNTDLAGEFAALTAALNLTAAEQKQLLCNSAEAAFADEVVKQHLRNTIDAYFAETI